MRITIFGAGALGSVIGGLMAESHTVTLVCREDHAREINADGLWFDGLVERKAFPRGHCRCGRIADPGPGHPDGESVRYPNGDAHDLPSDGRGNLHSGRSERIDRAEGRGGIRPWSLGGNGQFWCRLHRTGACQADRDGGHCHRKSRRCQRPRAFMAMGSLSSTGIPCRRSTDIRKEVWRKAVTSSCINPITALTRKTELHPHRRQRHQRSGEAMFRRIVFRRGFDRTTRSR